MAKKEKCPECEKGAPLWMLTYGDTITLMLCFFVAIFATAKSQQTASTEIKIISSVFGGSLGILQGGNTLSKSKVVEMGLNIQTMPSMEVGKSTSKALQTATEIFKPEIENKTVNVQEDERGIVISLIGSDAFAPGSARLTEETRKTLLKAGNLIRSLDTFVRVEGHADETSVVGGASSERYDTNWELAAARSVNVLRYLHEAEGVEPAKLSAVSYGKYRHLVNSQTPEGRAINRRVDIVILTHSKFKRDYADSELPANKTSGTEWIFGQ